MHTTPEPFYATVSPALLGVSASFFNNSLEAILIEMAQNARRAGATQFRLSWDEKTARGSPVRLTLIDNGRGCEPQDLLTLGGSNWGEEVKEQETPAGIGFFALSRSSPTIYCPSRGWKVVLTQAHFEGKALIAPEEYEADESDVLVGNGLRIEFIATFPYGREFGTSDLYKIFTYSPLVVFYNQSRIETQRGPNHYLQPGPDSKRFTFTSSTGIIVHLG